MVNKPGHICSEASGFSHAGQLDKHSFVDSLPSPHTLSAPLSLSSSLSPALSLSPSYLSFYPAYPNPTWEMPTLNTEWDRVALSHEHPWTWIEKMEAKSFFMKWWEEKCRNCVLQGECMCWYVLIMPILLHGVRYLTIDRVDLCKTLTLKLIIPVFLVLIVLF